MRFFWMPLLALVLLAQTPTVWAKDRLIVLAGQSNMMGRGKVHELPATYKTTPANVKYFYQGREHPLAKFAWFGPEVSFAHDVARAFPNDTIILVKQAASGSLIQQWQPEQALYKALLRQVGFATPKDTTLQADAILWMQGESDAQESIGVAQQYGKRLTTLVTQLRTDLASPDSLFIYGQVNLDHEKHAESIASVRNQQQAAQQQLPGALMVSTDGLGKQSDGIHYDAAGQMELGKRFAKAYIEQMK
ncbi:sialate O-acetylesterase [Thiothrix winogradskyi]|uniref:Sialate O-acetylesterase n=1 Tax=Thiothrix winogradskyi TaxID=96472 RepID=A0ABY3STH4_9GAMM|nr:sialate O-acetylesterase [Thiothrix winogradskyi]UJS22783.1 sialate O-acetylesterase [Thiothrix winogradskyi]